MGKLIKNGVEYSGSSNKAQTIAYDNSTSKLGATTAQGAIDEVVTGRLNQLTFVKLTQSEYDALATKDHNTIYFTTD